MAEEKKNIKVASEDENPKKLSYEQLEAYAAQTTEQAKKIFQENQMLKRALYEQSLKEVEIAIKCLDHAEKFSVDFIDAVTKRIEEIMTPQSPEAAENNKEE